MSVTITDMTYNITHIMLIIRIIYMTNYEHYIIEKNLIYNFYIFLY